MRQFGLWTILFLAFSVAISACGGAKYDDAKEVMNKYLNASESYINSMEKATEEAAIADAVNEFAAQIEKIAPDMKIITEKYPELKDRTKTPPELEELTARMNALGGKMAGAMMKPKKYMKDQKVREADQRLQKAFMMMMK